MAHDHHHEEPRPEREVIWSEEAWDDYLWWERQDKKTMRRINALIKDIERNGVDAGEGKPEMLHGPMGGEYSRRIDHENRLVYRMEDGNILILGCRGHYDDH